MTVSTAARTVAYPIAGGDTTLGPFELPFSFGYPNEIKGRTNSNETLVEGVDFNVTGNGVAGNYVNGQLTLTTPRAGKTLVFWVETPAERSNDYAHPISTEGMNRELDRIARRLIELTEIAQKNQLFLPGDGFNPAVPGGRSGGKVLGFTESGGGWQVYDLGDNGAAVTKEELTAILASVQALKGQCDTLLSQTQSAANIFSGRIIVENDGGITVRTDPGASPINTFTVMPGDPPQLRLNGVNILGSLGDLNQVVVDVTALKTLAETAAGQAQTHRTAAEAAAGAATTAAQTASDNADDAGGAAALAQQYRDQAYDISRAALVQPRVVAELVSGDFLGNARAFSQADVGQMLVIASALGSGKKLTIPPNLFTGATNQMAFIEVMNTSANSVAVEALVSAALKPIVRQSWHVDECLDATAAAASQYDYPLTLPAMNKGVIAIQESGLFSGLDGTGHDIVPSWQSGISGSWTSPFSTAHNGNAFTLWGGLRLFTVPDAFAGASAVLRLSAKKLLNGFSAFIWAIDETDGYAAGESGQLYALSTDAELQQPLPVTVVTSGANRLSLAATWKRSDQVPPNAISPGTPAFGGSTKTATQTDNLFVLSYAASIHERAAAGSADYQGTFKAGGIRRYGTQVATFLPRTGASASTTLLGATSIPAGKIGRLRLFPDGRTAFLEVSA